METRRVSRTAREGLLRHLAIVGLLGAFAVGVTATAGSAATAEKLTLLVEGGGRTQLVDIADLYTAETGVEVELVELPYTGLYDRVSTDLRSGNPAWDLAAIDAVWLADFEDGLEPLDELFTDDVKADLFPALVAEPYRNGQFVGLPAWTNAEIIWYREDLFADPDQQAAFAAEYGYDLAPPTTWEQYRDVAEFFTQDTDGDGTPDLYGTNVVGSTEAEWLATVLQAGSPTTVLDANGAPIINDAAHKLALDYYVSLVPFSPPGPSQVGWAEAYNLFDQGQTAMMRFWASAYRSIAPDSVINDNTGTSAMIAGPGGGGAIPGAWYLAIPKGSATSAAAKDFIQFAYDHNDVAIEKASFGVGSRISAFEKFQDQPGYEYITPLIDTLNNPATQPRPGHPKWQQIVDSVLIPLLQSAVQPGADTSTLLNDAQTQIEGIVQ